ncbi:MAG: redox-regulated ATPase YchF [Thermacetogeniaceae bacterium]|jgi:GTP-binding protein YchF|nr:redox-regulated ATPase YchF [Syntrophomonadaceae bacterium]
MALTCGIIGLPLVGKTTLFNLLTQGEEETSSYAGRTKTSVRVAKIPDKRLDLLAEIYHPRKVTPATLEVTDLPGLNRGSGAAFLNAVREVDALIHVVRAFRNDNIPHIDGDINPLSDLENVNAELFLADLQMVETRLERIAASKKIKGETLIEQEALKRCQEVLNEEKPLLEAGLSDDEWQAVRSLGFLTTKPMILVINMDEDQLRDGHYEGEESVSLYGEEKGFPVLSICLELEAEIALLDPGERELFLREMGISEPGVERVAKTIYEHLGLISFLTVGPDEVKAWTINKGTAARAAAGKVHTDIERGFIRAEVVKYEDMEKYRDMTKIKDKGLARLEGKDYIVQDGDIIEFRFNI